MRFVLARLGALAVLAPVYFLTLLLMPGHPVVAAVWTIVGAIIIRILIRFLMGILMAVDSLGLLSRRDICSGRKRAVNAA